MQDAPLDEGPRRRLSLRDQLDCVPVYVVWEITLACNLKCNYDYFSPELACELTRMSGFLMSTGVMKINLHSPHLMGEFLNAVQVGVTF